ncbi:MAG: hypothetical protein H6623_09750 [Bdellovibrionaceae bacterium]|nr:hypothetical protein [Pseudobdellovibrionaceae bacterium]
MKKNNLFLFFFSFLFVVSAFAGAPQPTDQHDADDIIGDWQAVGYYYKDDYIKPEDPKVILTFSFHDDTTNQLFWKYKDESAFCERHGQWVVQDGILHDIVTWVNPENGPSCSSDPDMQLGQSTFTRFWREGDNLYLQIPLGEDFLVYVWQPLVTVTTPDPQ